MKKILLFLTALLLSIGVCQAEEKTETFTVSNISFSSITNGLKYVGDNFTITFLKENGTTVPAKNGNYVRLYYNSNGNGGSLTIESNDGSKKIKQIITDCESSYLFPSSSSCVSDANVTLTPSSTTQTWKLSEVASTVKLQNTNTSNKQVRVGTVKVIYEENGKDEPKILGDILCTASDGKTVENGASVSVFLGTSFTLSAENATKFTLIAGNESGYEDMVEETGSTLKWTPAEICDNVTVMVEAENDEGDSKDFEFSLNVQKLPEGIIYEYRLVKSSDEIEEGESYIIAYDNNSKTYAIGEGTSNIPGVEVSISNEVLTPTSDTKILELQKKNYSGKDYWVWVVTNEDSKYKGNYVCNTTSTTTTLGTDITKAYCDASIVSGNLQIKYQGTSRYLLGYYGNSKSEYRAYTSTSQSDATLPKLYKRYVVMPDTPAEPQEFKAEFEDVNLRVGDEGTIVLKNETYPVISYSLKDGEDIISLEGTTVKALKEGETTISATWNADDNWLEGNAVINVTVKPALIDGAISFRYEEVRGKLGVGVTAQAAYYEGDGKIVYSSSNPAVATVNSETGMIRPDDVKSVGETIITAKVDATDTYTAGQAQYKVIIEAPEEGAPVSAEGNFDFTPVDAEGNRAYGMFPFNKDSQINYRENLIVDGKNQTVEYYESTISTGFNGAYSDHIPVSKVTAADNSNLTLEFGGTNNTRSWYHTNGTHLRVYNGTELKFSVAKGSIAKIEFVKGKALGKLALTDEENGKYTTSGTSQTSATWVPNDGETASSVNFYYKETSESTEIYTIKVTINVPASDVKQPAELGFNDEDRIVNTFVGVREKLPVLTHNVAFDKVKFDVDEIDEANPDEDYDNYKIEPNSDVDMYITVNDPGVYTFRAYFDGDDTHYAGMAILRLNVFPRLSVLPDNDSDLSEDERTEAPDLTLVKPNEEGNATTINLPTLEELENSFKYSTVAINKIEIKHGDTVKTYENETLGDAPASFDFEEDGYVYYAIRYASTEDFTAETKVHVIFEPETPADAETENSTEEAREIMITPSKNAKLWYCKSSIAPGEEFDPEIPSVLKVRRYLAATDTDTDGQWVEADDAILFSRPATVSEQESYAIKFLSVKDISNIVSEGVDGKLISEPNVITIDGNGVITGVEDLETDIVSDDKEPEIYNLQGVKMRNAANLPAGIYIVNGRKVVI